MIDSMTPFTYDSELDLYSDIELYCFIMKQLDERGILFDNLERCQQQVLNLYKINNYTDFEYLYNIQVLSEDFLSKVIEGDHSPWRSKKIKPRIDLYIDITTQKNLRIVWYPTNYNSSPRDSLKNTDFRYFDSTKGLKDRPDNELLFLRDIGPLQYYGGRGIHQGYDYQSLNKLIIKLLLRYWRKFQGKLALDFKVTLGSTIRFNKDIDYCLEVIDIEDNEDKK